MSGISTTSSTDNFVQGLTFNTSDGVFSLTQGDTGSVVSPQTVDLDGRYLTSADIVDLSNAVTTNTTDVATNRTNIATNTTNIATNTTDIAGNTTAIATNTTNIATNTTDIATNATALNNCVTIPFSQTITGLKTFNSFPLCSQVTPSNASELVNKRYVDSVAQTTFYGFSAYASSDDTVAVGDAIYFNEDEENDGNLSNTDANGSIYTVVKKGFYFIHAQVYTSNSNSYPWIQIVKEKPSGDKTNLGGIYQAINGLSNSNCACVAELEVNDEIYVTPRTSGFKLLGRDGQSATQGIFSNFSAFIIRET